MHGSRSLVSSLECVAELAYVLTKLIVHGSKERFCDLEVKRTSIDAETLHTAFLIYKELSQRHPRMYLWVARRFTIVYAI